MQLHRTSAIPDEGADRGSLKLQGRASTYAFWIAVLAATLLTVALYYFAPRSAHPEIVLSVASSLVASVLFALFFTVLSNREYLHLVRRAVAEETLQSSERIIGRFDRYVAGYVPSRVFSATGNVDVAFNRSLSLDLRNSSFYLFRGVSAKYVPVRVTYSRGTLSRLTVIMLDPRDKTCITLRARDRRDNPHYAHKSVAELSETLCDEIYMSVVALYDCRHICPVEIAYISGTSVARLEIFSDALYLSMYHAGEVAGAAFPETVRYDNSSMLYQLYRLDSYRSFDLATERIRFDATTPESSLREHLRKLGARSNQESVTMYRSRYAAFAEEFASTSRITELV